MLSRTFWSTYLPEQVVNASMIAFSGILSLVKTIYMLRNRSAPISLIFYFFGGKAITIADCTPFDSYFLGIARANKDYNSSSSNFTFESSTFSQIVYFIFS